jgi:hypothetical protein
VNEENEEAMISNKQYNAGMYGNLDHMIFIGRAAVNHVL